MRNTNTGWTGKDLGLTLGLALIYLAITLTVQISGALMAFAWLFMTPLIALFAWLPYLYLTARVQKAGAVLIINLVVVIAYWVAGELSALLLASLLACAILAEIARKLSGYNSFKGNLVSYLLMAFSTVGSPLYVWVSHDYAIEECVEEMSPAYARAVEGLSSPGMLIAMLLATIVTALIGGALSRVVFRKQFQKFCFV